LSQDELGNFPELSLNTLIQPEKASIYAVVIIVTVERREGSWLLRLEGEMTLQSAAALRTALIEWLTSGSSLDLDLTGVGEIDLAGLQLLGATVREAGRRGLVVAGRASDPVISAAHDSGFDQLSGFPFQKAG
jgi:anti-anti-sigma regulatory factor